MYWCLGYPELSARYNSIGSFSLEQKLKSNTLSRTEEGREFNVREVMAVSSATDASDFSDGITFVSQNQDRISVSRVPMIGTADIVALPKGQAFVMLNGSQPWKIRIPMPSKADDKDLPDHLADMLVEMRDNYSSVVDWHNYKDSLDLSMMENR